LKPQVNGRSRVLEPDRVTEAFEGRGVPVLPPVRRGAVAAPGMLQPLSTREHEVLILLAAGRSNRAIAEELFITSTR
jgi:LuxR family maltose regulon positive regulatory protein